MTAERGGGRPMLDTVLPFSGDCCFLGTSWHYPFMSSLFLRVSHISIWHSETMHNIVMLRNIQNLSTFAYSFSMQTHLVTV